MKASTVVTYVGLLVTFAYILKTSSKFYDVGFETYGPYLIFYAFLILTIILFPTIDTI